ncbi:MAG: chromate efflux transporter [Phycisphaerae bacterium]|nr:chromate efflux transporter [Phycisphaerae bacterium]
MLFTRLGVTAFGGPAAHIAMMQEEVVRRRKWLSDEEFLDLLSATQLIPGPNSTEMAIHIGHRRAGFAGLLVAGACFIIPAVVIVLALARIYVQFGSLPALAGMLDCVKPVIIAIVLQAVWNLGRSAVKNTRLAVVGAGALAANLCGLSELATLAAAAVATLGLHAASATTVRRNTLKAIEPFALFGLSAGVEAASANAAPAIVASLFGIFAKIGAVLYGSGYVLLAFVEAEFVHQRNWLTQTQLLDAVAVGQLTPGPVFTTATFVGYIIAGYSGAMAATGGIFLPAFLFVAISGPIVPRMRRSPLIGVLLDGVNVASLALMAAVIIELGRHAITTPLGGLLLTAAGLALLKYRINSTWIIAGAAIIGLLR